MINLFKRPFFLAGEIQRTDRCLYIALYYILFMPKHGCFVPLKPSNYNSPETSQQYLLLVDTVHRP